MVSRRLVEAEMEKFKVGGRTEGGLAWPKRESYLVYPLAIVIVNGPV